MSVSAEAREVARAAAHWLALLESGSANERDHHQLQAWRDSHARHEHAWQRAQLLRQRFSELPPSLALATLDRQDPGRREVMKRALAVAALLPTAWLISRQLPLDVWRADLHTATGERRTLPLADGSSLLLNTDTAVNVDLGVRRIALVRGEIALTVPGAAPLAIDTPYGRLHVSQSEVYVRLNSDNCRVSVVNGSVRLQPLSGPAQALTAGQRIRLQASGAGPLEPFDIAQPGWRDGVLTAQNQPLGDFLRELDRYRPGVLRWDPLLERLNVTGSFRLDNTDRVLDLLAASLPLEVHARTRYWVTLQPRKIIA